MAATALQYVLPACMRGTGVSLSRTTALNMGCSCCTERMTSMKKLMDGIHNCSNSRTRRRMMLISSNNIRIKDEWNKNSDFRCSLSAGVNV